MQIPGAGSPVCITVPVRVPSAVQSSCYKWRSSGQRLACLTKPGTHRPAIKERDEYEWPEVKSQNDALGLCQMQRDFLSFEERSEVLQRSWRQAPTQAHCSLVSSAENCSAAPVLVYLKNKRTCLGHTANGKANIGSSNWWFARSETFKSGNRDDPCLLIIIQ